MDGLDIIINDGIVKVDKVSTQEGPSRMWADAFLSKRSKWGVRLGIRWGPIYRPFGNDKWGSDPTLVIKLPWFILPWLAIHYKDYGFYVGGKFFDIGFGQYLTPSFSIRRTRII